MSVVSSASEQHEQHKHYCSNRPEVGRLVPAPEPELIGVKVGRRHVNAHFVVPLLAPMEVAGGEGETHHQRIATLE